MIPASPLVAARRRARARPAAARPRRGCADGAGREARRQEALAARAARPARPALAAGARRRSPLTAEFVPTEFVTPGRKGEVVEDEFQAARDAYRQHRALLYEARRATRSRARGRPLPASRYQRRAFLLEPTPDRGPGPRAVAQRARARARGARRPCSARSAGSSASSPRRRQVIARAADVAGLPSAQAEIDRGRLTAPLGEAVELREGPLELPPGVRLSTSADVPPRGRAGSRWSTRPRRRCRSCSSRPRGDRRGSCRRTRASLALPPGDDQDQALRQVLALYRRPWPLLARPRPRGAARARSRARCCSSRAAAGRRRCSRRRSAPSSRGARGARSATTCRRRVPRPRWNRRPGRPLAAAAAARACCPRASRRARTRRSRRSSTAAVEAYRAGRAQRGASSSSTRSRRRATAGCCRRRRGSTARSASRAPGSATRRGGSCCAPATAASRTRSTSCSRRWRRSRGSSGSIRAVRERPCRRWSWPTRPRGDRDEVRRDRDRVPAGQGARARQELPRPRAEGRSTTARRSTA